MLPHLAKGPRDARRGLRPACIRRGTSLLGSFIQHRLIGWFTLGAIFPGLAAALKLAHMAPMGIFEFTLGFCLMIRGLRTPAGQGSGPKVSASMR